MYAIFTGFDFTHTYIHIHTDTHTQWKRFSLYIKNVDITLQKGKLRGMILSFTRKINTYINIFCVADKKLVSSLLNQTL